MVSSFDMDTFVDHELGQSWVRTFDAAGGSLHTAIRPDLRSNGFTCNVVVQEIPAGEPTDLRATIPTASILLASSGLEARGTTAELLFVDDETDTTQWIGYRFDATPPLQIVVSAATPDWPAIAPMVARMSNEGTSR